MSNYLQDFKDIMSWPLIWIMLLLFGGIAIVLIYQIYFASPSAYELTIDSLSCTELKEWLKFKDDTWLFKQYAERCLQV